MSDVFSVDFAGICGKHGYGQIRAVASRYLIRYSGMSQREIAEMFNVICGSAISKNLSRYKEMLSCNKRLVKLQKRIENILDEYRKNIN